MVGGDTHGMGHHGWGNPLGNETSEVRWVGRDTIDETGTRGGRQTLPAEIAVLPELTIFLETCPLYMLPTHHKPVFKVLISPKTHAMKNLTFI